MLGIELPDTRPQTHPCSMSNHPLLDPKHTLVRYRTTRYSTSNTPLLDIEPPVTRPQTHPCSISNYPLLDLKHTLVRCRTSRSRPHFEASLSPTFFLNGLTISHLKPKPLIWVTPSSRLPPQPRSPSISLCKKGFPSEKCLASAAVEILTLHRERLERRRGNAFGSRSLASLRPHAVLNPALEGVRKAPEGWSTPRRCRASAGGRKAENCLATVADGSLIWQ